MITVISDQYVCIHRAQLAFKKTQNCVGAVYEITCDEDSKCPDQPDRSKREDLHHKDCIPWIKHNCWHSYNQRDKCEHKEDCDLIVGARMRCSEHCGNTVREVQ